jgi:magnesium-protoporphyrin O-methyltransferase
MHMTDIKEHCCGADQFFDLKTAKKQYKRYLRNGPSKVTKKLIGQLEKTNIGEFLLDVGGGIGAIQWWFLSHGGKQTFGVDASSGYTDLVKEHAAKNNLKESTHFMKGDFIAKAEELPKVDHVTLDKVICCYPDFEAILNLACAKAIHTVSLSYPMDGFIADIFRGFGVLFMKLSGNPFRPYIHRVESIRALFAENGFEVNEKELSFPWYIETYAKR